MEEDMDHNNRREVELEAKSIYKGKICLSHNQLEQIRGPRPGVVDRILLNPKATESNAVQAILKEKETKYH